MNSAIERILDEIEKSNGGITGVRGPAGVARGEDEEGVFQDIAMEDMALDDIARLRGRPLFYAFVGSGRGRGALVELMDGSVKWDFITSIGTHFFGHGDRRLMRVAVEAALSDIPIQGHLQPNREYVEFLRAVSAVAPGRCKHVWPSMSGSMANENALKMIRQKRAPAFRVLAFSGAFAGRTAVMSEISDNAANKKGQPDLGQVTRIPFYDLADTDSITKTIYAMEGAFKAHRGEFCAIHVELVQGEGGCLEAPREFFEAVFDRCRRENVAIWVDEIQTFGRTGEYFMLTRLELEEWADVVTIGKMLCGSAALFSPEYNPEPGLISGTFAGYTAGLALGAHVVGRLRDDGMTGREGKIRRLEEAVAGRLKEWQKRRMIRDYTVVGAMAAFTPARADLDSVRAVVRRLFDAGVCVYYAGHDSYRVRMLLPAGCLAPEDIEGPFGILEKAIT